VKGDTVLVPAAIRELSFKPIGTSIILEVTIPTPIN
jgi:hypothetical protein